MNKQQEILLSTAARHGLTKSQAEEIWQLFGGKIAEEISNSDKKEGILYTVDKFPVIHIDNFGKFIPNQRKIRHANFCLIRKKHKDDNTNEHNV
jgi:nucleoid DNA-binding protein